MESRAHHIWMTLTRLHLDHRLLWQIVHVWSGCKQLLCQFTWQLFYYFWPIEPNQFRHTNTLKGDINFNWWRLCNASVLCIHAFHIKSDIPGNIAIVLLHIGLCALCALCVKVRMKILPSFHCCCNRLRLYRCADLDFLWMNWLSDYEKWFFGLWNRIQKYISALGLDDI